MQLKEEEREGEKGDVISGMVRMSIKLHAFCRFPSNGYTESHGGVTTHCEAECAGKDHAAGDHPPAASHHASSSLLSHRVASLVVIVFFLRLCYAGCATERCHKCRTVPCCLWCSMRIFVCVSIRMYMSIYNGIPGANRRNSRAGRRGLAQRFLAAEDAVAEVPCGKAFTAQSTTFYEKFAGGAGRRAFTSRRPPEDDRTDECAPA